jgi:hypothetical protein
MENKCYCAHCLESKSTDERETSLKMKPVKLEFTGDISKLLETIELCNKLYDDNWIIRVGE